MVGLLQSKNAFLANLAVFRTSDRMVGVAAGHRRLTGVTQATGRPPRTP